MAKKGSICVLVSGGIDSAVLTAEMSLSRRTVYPVFIRQGLRWEKIELHWLRRFLKAIHSPSLNALHVLSIPMADVYGSHWSTGRGPVPGGKSLDSAVYLPGRNLVLLVKAAILAQKLNASEIALGSLGHNPFPDATPAFFAGVGRVVSEALGSQIRIIAPYRSLEKTEVIRRGRRWPLEKTFSCLAPRGAKHCGACNKCAERQSAFRKAAVPDRTLYVRKPKS